MLTTESTTDIIADSQSPGVVVDTVLLKVASRCNINCRYCYVYHMGDTDWTSMPKVMSRSTIAAIASSLARLYRAQCRPFSVVLHGGEPFLLGEDELAFTLSTLTGALPFGPALCIQTNGILVTDRILDICAEHHTCISVSIDGPSNIHDR